LDGDEMEGVMDRRREDNRWVGEERAGNKETNGMIMRRWW